MLRGIYEHLDIGKGFKPSIYLNKCLLCLCFSVKKAGLSFEEMFEEVPLVIKNSHLTNALCCELEEVSPPENPYDFLDLATRYAFLVISVQYRNLALFLC